MLQIQSSTSVTAVLVLPAQAQLVANEDLQHLRVDSPKPKLTLKIQIVSVYGFANDLVMVVSKGERMGHAVDRL
jgi:hypothetical protein